MKVIDLLNKIANGEEVPKKIKPSWWYEVEEYLYYDEETKDYYNKEDTYELIGTICLFLNDEIEIIEDKKIDHLSYEETSLWVDDEDGKKPVETIVAINNKELVNKINEIIDCINKEK